MKKIIFGILCFYMGLQLISNNSASAFGSDHTSVTCYSTIQTGGSWTITRCGTCRNRARIKQFIDKGSCKVTNQI